LPGDRDSRDRGDRGNREERGGRRPYGRGGGGFRGGPGGRRGRTCPFCERKAKEVDYKLADELRRFLTERGKIKPRRKNATCARHQRSLTIAIKRARQLALLPFSQESSRG
jgi:small subunit ribosomal protein S18